MASKSTLLLALSSAVLSVAIAVDKKEEPPLRVLLTLDGAKHTVALDSDFTFQIDGKERSGRVEVAPTRRFEHRGVSFEYPTDFAFESIPVPEREIFTLQGDNTLLILQYFEGTQDPAELTSSVTGTTEEQYKELDYTREKVEAPFMGRVVEGQRLTVSMGTPPNGGKFRQDFFGFPAEGTTLVVCLQANLKADDSEHAAAELVRSLLQQSLRTP